MAVMVSHALEQGVLVVTVHDDPGSDGRAVLLARISDLVKGHAPTSLVLVLDGPAAADSAVGVVLRVHRLCSRLGLVMSVATHSAPVRRLLEADADAGGTRLVVLARADTAIRLTAAALTAAA
ncbi:hypothetical protein ABT270_31905 [Streptomyces sp900105245]|uniref:hypothetical protein n=1 Tax=unclassified Streptomyces TaxID=2593676 RepID=UPI000A6C1948|nr:hypothetical protein [Streptomyces sp. CB01883]